MKVMFNKLGVFVYRNLLPTVLGFNLFFCINIIGLSQSLDWIKFNQPYYKIQAASNGIYRIDHKTLTNSGLNAESINPQQLKMYHRGKEVAIFFQGDDDGKWDQEDYLYFYGTVNDGTLDKQFFTNAEFNGNKMYNMHSDTTAYFLTLSPSNAGKRVSKSNVGEVIFPQTQLVNVSKTLVYSDQYNLGASYLYGVRLPKFEQGQGWMSAPITKSTPRTINLSGLGEIGSSGQPKLILGAAGRSEVEHQVIVSVGKNEQSLQEIGRFVLKDYQVSELEFPFSISQFQIDGKITVQVTINATEGNGQISLAYIELIYPQIISKGNFERLTFLGGTEESSYFFEGANQSYLAWDISNPIEPKQLPLIANENGLILNKPSSLNPVKIHVENISKVIEISEMHGLYFRDIENVPADYLIISHASLRRPVRGVQDPVAEYASYRSSVPGGGYRVLSLDIQELYDMYSYGEQTPLAIYQFLKAYYPKFKPDYLVLMGRSMGIYSTVRANGVNQFYRKNPSIFPFQDLVPTAGYPPADNNFTVGLNPNDPLLAAIATGRIPAKRPEDILNYLEKVKEKDIIGVSEEWQKNLLHLSGGLSALELNRYFTFLNDYKKVAEGIFLGGNVKTFRKTSNASVEVLDVTQEVNSGLSLITFFGHAAPSVTDIEIGFASDPTLNFRNRGKYPMLFLNGCDAGNAFGTAYTFGEDWVITPQKGASAFLAHAHTGVDLYLRRYGESFYNRAFTDSLLIGETIGKIKIQSEKLMYQRYGASPIQLSHVDNMVLLGDPAVKLFPTNLPDYEIKAEEIQLIGFGGQQVNALSDSLQLLITIKNLGIVSLKELEVAVTRKLPNGTTLNLPSVSAASVFYRDTLKFTIPNEGLEAFGDNEFLIHVNPKQAIQEKSFMNNQALFRKFIPKSGPIPLKPSNFSIVNQNEIDFYVQIPSQTNKERQIIIELDTTVTFTSSFKKSEILKTSGLAKWPVSLFERISPRDTLTFFWRTKFLMPEEGEIDDWSLHSFTYISNGSPGWMQRTLEQLALNNLSQIKIDPTQQKWAFEDIQLPIEVYTFGTLADSLTFRNTQLYLNGTPFIIDNINNVNTRLCANGSLALVAFDQRSLVPYLVFPPTSFDVLDNRSCGRVPQVIQNIRNSNITSTTSNLLIDYINGVNDGDFVVIFSVGGVTFESWPETVRQKMKELGATASILGNIKNGEPYVLIGRKGMKSGEAMEIIGNSDESTDPKTTILKVDTVLEGYFTSASILTPKIGPSSEWLSFFNHLQSRDWLGEQRVDFEIIGINTKGEEKVIVKNQSAKDLNLSMISAISYPFLKLKMAMENPLATEPVQLSKWQVLNNGVPEGALILKAFDGENRIPEGKLVNMLFEFKNISQIDFKDSLMIEWEFFAPEIKKNEKQILKIPALKAGENYEFEVKLNTRAWLGKVNFKLTANPRLQMEETFLNNSFDVDGFLEIQPDRTRAILDVNFDGIYIMDGDIVSPEVTINTTLKNEKTFLYKSDTMGIDLYLSSNCAGCIFNRINFSDAKVEWTPASQNKDFQVRFKAGPLEDGIYTYRVVLENDGIDKPYEVNFEVINTSSITNFYPYPNPFSSNVRFVFTVTGVEVPDQIKIQMLTVTGKVVKEIFQDEIGPVRIGNNITQYAWDGKDEFGDQLANGVYLYRVLVKHQGQFVELRNTYGDKAFKQGFGKLYLLR